MLYNSTDALIFRALMHMSSAYGLYTKTNNNALQKQTKTFLFQQTFIFDNLTIYYFTITKNQITA